MFYIEAIAHDDDSHMARRLNNARILAGLSMGVVLAMLTSGAMAGVGAGGPASGRTAVELRGAPVVPGINTTIVLNGTNITNSFGNVTGTLNNTTAHPWGEVYDSVNSCTYVTEDPATSPAGQGYLTYLSPGQPIPVSTIIPGGLNPQGIAWELKFYGESALWKSYFSSGILAIADTGSNSVSFFGIPAGSSGVVSCQPIYLQTDSYLPDHATSGVLAGPWDVIADSNTNMFYVTWALSSVVSAFDGTALGCEFTQNMTEPLGLSADGAGRLEVANFAANGWVTELKTTPVSDSLPGLCLGNVPVADSLKVFDRALWTVYAPLLFKNNSTTGFKASVAVSDSNYGINGNVIGPGTPIGCKLGLPLDHMMGIVTDGALVCKNAVRLEPTALPTSAGAYGLAYNGLTRHVLVVLNTQGIVEGVDYTHAFYPGDQAAPASSPQQSVEVIWFSSSAAFYDGTAAAGSMIVTNWGAGTLYIATGL